MLSGVNGEGMRWFYSINHYLDMKIELKPEFNINFPIKKHFPSLISELDKHEHSKTPNWEYKIDKRVFSSPTSETTLF